MGTTVGGKDIATTGSNHQAVSPPAVSLNPPAPPGPGPVPVPYPYLARSATAKETSNKLKAGGKPVLVKGSVMNVEAPANQPSQPTGGDIVTHAVKGKAVMSQGSTGTTAGGKPVCRFADMVRMNVVTGQQAVAQQTVPLLKAAGSDMAGGKGGKGAGKDKKKKNAKPAQSAKRCSKAGHPVDVATGYVVDEAEDFALPGAIPLVWRRTYSSSRAAEKSAHGKGGWVHSFDQWIERKSDSVILHDGDGRTVVFLDVEVLAAQDGVAPAPPRGSFHRGERLTLTPERDGGFLVYEHDTRLTRCFAPLAPRGRAVLRAIRDVYGHAIRLDYEDGALALVTDTAGRGILITNDAKGRVTRVEVWAAPPGESESRPAELQLWVDYAYTAEGELESATDALGHADLFAYDGLHRMVRTTLKNGVSFSYEYDEDTGACVKTWGDDDLHLVDLHFDNEAGVTTTGGTNEPRRYFWNSDGLVIREETFGGDFAIMREYDADQHLVSESNAAGEAWRFERDARGRLVKRVDPACNETTWEYDDTHDLPTKRTAPGGLVTTYRHDGRGALIEVTYPSGLRYTLDNDAHGRVTAVYGADGRLAAFGYDAQHNLAWEESARGARTRYTYDALGRPIARTDALGRTTRVAYDRLRRPIEVRFPDGTSTRAEYEPLGNVSRFTDALGQVTAMEYAGTGVLAKLTQADGLTWRFVYDEDERLRRILNPRLEEYDFAYNWAGQVETEKTFDGRYLEYQHDKAGRLARIGYPDDTWREFSYDVLGNVVEERSPDGDIAYERDALGRLSKATLSEYNGKIVTELERDRLGRVVTEKQNGRTIRHDYDARGRRAFRVLPGGQTTRYQYDVLGALAGVDHDGHKVLVERDALGRETRKHVYQGKVDIQRSYDAMDRLAEQRVTAPAPAGGDAVAELARRRWSYDTNGRVQRIDDMLWGSTLYEYDAIGQLLSAKRARMHEVFEYDPTGSLRNILGKLSQVGQVPTWEIRPGNVLVRTPGAEYKNDGRGRRVKKVVRIQEAGSKAREEVTTYGWDCRDRLREVVLPDGRRVLYTYDAFARRVRKEVIPAERRDYPAMVKLALAAGKDALPKSRVVEFLWDGDVLAGELDPEEGARFFVHEPGTFVPLLQQEQGAVFTYVNDHLGTPKELVDQDGRVAWAAGHSAWGRVVEVQRDPHAARAVESPFRLLGQYHDEETGLCYTRFRYFDAALGRWCSPDPLGIGGGANLFALDGAPTATIDPLGLAPPCPKAQAKAKALAEKMMEEMAEPGAKLRKDKDTHFQDHGFTDEMVKNIIADPDMVYLAGGKSGRMIFRQGDDIVAVEGPGSAQRTVVTAYGPSGVKGDSGAAALGGLPTDQGTPVTHSQIVNGTIPTAPGKPGIPAAVPVWTK
jgi:RHS repeat-associated protein